MKIERKDIYAILALVFMFGQLIVFTLILSDISSISSNINSIKFQLNGERRIIHKKSIPIQIRTKNKLSRMKVRDNYLELSCLNDDAQSCENLGYVYGRGLRGVIKNYRKSNEFFVKAYELNAKKKRR